MVLLSALTVVVASQARAATIEVPFTKTDEAIIVDAVVNRRNVSLMFDTGFSGAVIVNDVIDVGKPTGKINLRDFVGQFEANTVKVTSLKLGNKVIEPKDMTVVQQPAGNYTESYGVHCDGIMGFEVIRNYITEINFEKSRFIFHPKTLDISKRTPDNKRTFLARLLPKGNNSMEMSVAAPNGKKMTLALDTGNAFFATTHKDVLERVGVWPAGRNPKFMKLSGVASGTVESWYVRMKDMNIYGIPVPDSVWSIIDAPSSSAEGDGTVGYQFLKNFNIIIDYDRRRVWLENWTGKFGNEAKADIGISASYNPEVKRVMVYRVSPDSPAQKAGIRGGDLLLSVNGVDVPKARFDELSRMFEGDLGTTVRVSTSRNGNLQRHELSRVYLINELDAK